MARGPKTFDYHSDTGTLTAAKRKSFNPDDTSDLRKITLPDGTTRLVEKNVHSTRT